MRIENIENRLADRAAMLAAKARQYLNPDEEVSPSELQKLSETQSEVGTALDGLSDSDKGIVIGFTAQEWIESQEVIRQVQEEILAVLAREEIKDDTGQGQNPGLDQDTKV